MKIHLPLGVCKKACHFSLLGVMNVLKKVRAHVHVYACILFILFRTHPIAIGIHMMHAHIVPIPVLAILSSSCQYHCLLNSLSLPLPTHVHAHAHIHNVCDMHTHAHARTHTVLTGGNPQNDKQTTFLAWQTWDLLRLTIEGFIGLCSDFLVRNPGYFIKPIRINRSVIESLFGRFKYNSGGNLSSVNYHNCVAKLVIADASNAKEDYRAVQCDHKGVLVKKKYNRN